MVLVVGVISVWFSMFMSGGKDYFLMYVEDDRAWLLELVEDADSGQERLFWEEKVRELDDLVEEVE